MESKKLWCAIGDSFTYLNDHPDETCYRVKRGYLSRILDKVPSLKLINAGINGSNTRDWLSAPIPKADIYTILLGTNDWHAGIPLGSESDFIQREQGSILGNLALLTERIKKASPGARIVVGNPVERADFVYLLDHNNNAPGSYRPENGVWLRDVAKAIFDCCINSGIPAVDLNGLSGFTQDKLIKFKRVKVNGAYKNLPYPDYIDIPFTPGADEYPFPEEAIALTYDGLHPSDEGCEILAELFAAKMLSIPGYGV